MDCRQCSSPLDTRFRYCPWCGAVQRKKLVEFFAGHPDFPEDAGRAVRVSRYLEPEAAHTRLSIWNEQARAESVISLDEAETRRLARFLLRTPARAAAGAGVPEP